MRPPLTVLLFGPVREAAGEPSVVLPLPAGATVRTLLLALAAALPGVPLALLQRCVVAVDDAYYAPDEPLPPTAATVAVIPPVSGG